MSSLDPLGVLHRPRPHSRPGEEEEEVEVVDLGVVVVVERSLRRGR
jgi:hypothetical protein